MNKTEFVEHEKSAVKELLEKLKNHRDQLEDNLKMEPDDDEARDMLEDAEEGIEALEPIAADYDKAGVDPEELVQYAETIDEWRRKEEQIARKLG